MIRKLTKKILALSTLALLSSYVFAKSWTFTTSNETATVELPDDLTDVISDNYDAIQDAIISNGVTKADINSAVSEINKYYNSMTSTGFSYSSLSTGLNDFCDALSDSIPNSQSLQNVWAESWIGHIFPGLHIGGGLNVGAASLDVSALKSAASSLDLDGASDIPSTLAFPTVAADLRVGGFILPFDVGLSFMTLSPFESLIDSALGDAPINFSYYSIGGDVRYAIIKGMPFGFKVSGLGGLYYTSGDVNLKASESSSSAALDFSATTFYLGAQASAKFLILVPFAGTRLMFTSSDVNWTVTPDWMSLLNSNATGPTETALLSLLPSKFSGGSENGFFDHIRPQIYGGLGLDLFLLNVTAVASYDFLSDVFGAALNLRLAW